MGKSIEKHYSSDNLLERIFGALVMEGKDPFSVTADDLAAIDEFHSRGRKSTVELAGLADPKSTDRVLDVGCGIGGSVRFLGHEFGCRVIGIDLTAEYIKVAEKLTELVGMGQHCTYVLGSATDLPFDDESFDLVWTEHAQMNIQDKASMYREIARVLKPQGCLAFHDIFAGANQPVFPLPWAEDDSISFLCTEDEARQMIRNNGLQLNCWESKIDESLLAFENAAGKLESGQTPPLGIHLLMGETARDKIGNYLKSMHGGAITIAMGVAIKSPEFP